MIYVKMAEHNASPFFCQPLGFLTVALDSILPQSEMASALEDIPDDDALALDAEAEDDAPVFILLEVCVPVLVFEVFIFFSYFNPFRVNSV